MVVPDLLKINRFGCTKIYSRKTKEMEKIAKLMAADELEKGTKNELTDDRELNVIGDMLSLLRRRLRIAKETGAYSTFGEGDVMYCFDDRELGKWFDSTRGEILKVLSLICEDVGIPSLYFPQNKYKW